MYFSPKGERIQENDGSHQSNPPRELNDPLVSFISSLSHGTRADSESADHWSLLNQLPSSSWGKFPTDIGKIHSAPLIKIQTDSSKSVCRINQKFFKVKSS